jgi:hypothetical protein
MAKPLRVCWEVQAGVVSFYTAHSPKDTSLEPGMHYAQSRIRVDAFGIDVMKGAAPL